MKLNIEIDGISKGTNILDIEVPEHMRRRCMTGLDFVDDVLGGNGIVPSQVILFTGTPGAGKTTSMLQLADKLSANNNVLFNSREESLYQIKMTSERLKLKSGFVAGQDEMVKDIIEHTKFLMDASPQKDTYIVVDSLQTIDDGFYSNGTNGKTPVRSLEMLSEFCKRGYKDMYPILFIIGQVTKQGTMTGKNTLKHMIDTHMHLFVDIDKKSEFFGERVLECQKNRFGCSNKKYILGMESTGVYAKAEYSYD